jgi:hypothetical protein
VGALSGVALLVLYRPLVAKTETKRDTFGDAIREMSRRILLVAGYADDFRVVLTWPDVLPKDMAGEAATARELRDLGVSLRTVLERLGIDADQELERVRDEQSDPMGDARGLLDRLDEMQARIDAGTSGERPADPVA